MMVSGDVKALIDRCQPRINARVVAKYIVEKTDDEQPFNHAALMKIWETDQKDAQFKFLSLWRDQTQVSKGILWVTEAVVKVSGDTELVTKVIIEELRTIGKTKAWLLTEINGLISYINEILPPSVKSYNADKLKLLRDLVSRGDEVGVDNELKRADLPANEKMALLNEAFLADNGDTLLTLASRRGDVGIAKLLIDHGADRDRKNRNEQTSLQIAEAKKPPNQALIDVFKAG